MKKVGVIWIGHADYLGGGVDTVVGEIQSALSSIDSVGIDPPVVVTSDAQAVRAARAVLQSDFCGAILVLTSWVECNVVMSAVKELRGLPAIIWGFPSQNVRGQEINTGSYVSAAMFSGVVKRASLHAQMLIGSWEDAGVLARLCAFTRAASTADLLFYGKIGLFGYTSMSIYPGTFDHVLLRSRIGPEVEHMDSYSLISAAEAVPDETVEESIRLLTRTTQIQSNVQPEILKKTMRLYAALQSFVSEHHWAAVNVKCQYEFSKEYRVVPCVALSLLADSGVVASCEGDMLNTVSMLILGGLSGQTVTYGDSLTQFGNTVKFSPCGFMPPSMGCKTVRVQKFMAHPGFSGIQISGVLRPERVTYLRLVEDVGAYHLLYGTGAGKHTLPRDGCMPALDVELDGSVETLCKEYAGQHFALCYGDLSAEIEALAAVLGIPTVQI
ncbi:MAG TPA: hypothetical protein P5075_10200 [Eubacteriales bacterium]|nr:hypothetical protein [Eubacteriales bacterium]